MPIRTYSFLCILLATTSLPLQAEVYKSVDADGNVRYSDKAPNNSDVQTSKVKTNTQQNVTDSAQDIAERQPEWLTEAQQQRAEQETAKSVSTETNDENDESSSWHDEYQAAKAELKAAEQALKEGVVAGEGDFMGLAGGGVRPTEQFINKQAQLEQAVDDAKAKLKALKKSKP